MTILFVLLCRNEHLCIGGRIFFGILQKLIFMQIFYQNALRMKLQKLTRLRGKGALRDPGCAVFRLRHLGLHPGGRRDIPSTPSGKVVRLPTQKQ